MIKLEIIRSDDTEILGNKLLYKNQIFIGNNSSDVHISENISINYISIEVSEECATVSLNGDGHFLLNGKRSESTRKININDIVKVGNTEIKLIDAEYQIYQQYTQLITDNLKQIQQDNEELLNILYKIQEQVQ